MKNCIALMVTNEAISAVKIALNMQSGRAEKFRKKGSVLSGKRRRRSAGS